MMKSGAWAKWGAGVLVGLGLGMGTSSWGRDETVPVRDEKTGVRNKTLHGTVQLWEGGPYWAEVNIGAEHPWEYGLYFWWGDSDGSVPGGFSFSEENAPTYNQDNATLRNMGWLTAGDVLAPAHDAAHVHWGGGWRMPTDQEMDDLCYSKCDWTWTTMNGVNGYLVRGRGDYATASIFLPAAGYCNGTSLNATGAHGYYLSSEPSGGIAYYAALGLHIRPDGHATGSYWRYEGYSVRPVQDFAEFPVFEPPELGVERADIGKGSLTLGWKDADAGDGVTYSVWRGAGASRQDAKKVASGLTGTSWTDTAYWSAPPVLKPLNYWVVADGGGYGERVSNREETRHRYALGVGVGRYRDEDTWEPDVSDITNADLFKRLTDEGGFTTAVLSGSKATHEGIREQMRDLSSKAKTGDYLFVFCSSHGKTSWWRALAEAAGTTSLLEFQGVAMYDTVDKVYTFDHIYAPDEIKADLEACLADKNGVSLVFILNCCMSGGVTAYSPSNGDMAWITSCQEKALTPTWPRIGTPLPKYFFDYGWQQGMAGDTEYLTLANLLDYALPQLEVFFSKVNEHNTPVVKGRGILEHFIVGQPGNAAHTSEPDVPTGLSASLSGKELTVQWNNDTKADYFIVRRTNAAGDNTPLVYVGSGSSEVFSFQDKEASWFGTPYLYRVAAMNEWGISEWSDPRLGACMWKEWMDWIGPYFGFEEVSPEDLAAAAIATSANGATYATCYVAGLDPNDPNAAFTAELVREDGKWKAKPKGGEKEGRVYRVEGKKEMSDEAWTDVTTVEDLEAEGWHFFRVGVELAE